MHLFHIPQHTIRSRNVHISVQNGALWDMRQPLWFFCDSNFENLCFRYIKEPLLLNGKKFDIRAYMLIASTHPYLVLYHKGSPACELALTAHMLVRLSMQDYDTESEDLTAHLTNQVRRPVVTGFLAYDTIYRHQQLSTIFNSPFPSIDQGFHLRGVITKTSWLP